MSLSSSISSSARKFGTPTSEVTSVRNADVVPGASAVDSFSRVGDAVSAAPQAAAANARTARGPLSVKASLWFHTLTHPGTSWLRITISDNKIDVDSYLSGLEKNYPGYFARLKTDTEERTSLVNKMRAHWGFDSPDWSQTSYVEGWVAGALGIDRPSRATSGRRGVYCSLLAHAEPGSEDHASLASLCENTRD